MSESTDFWRQVRAVAAEVVDDALKRPTGIAPGVHSGITFDRYGRALHGGGGGLLALYHGTASGTIPYNAAGTEFVWDYGAKKYDPGSVVTTGTAWKATVRESGIYMVTASLQTGGAGGFIDTDNFYLYARKNGTATIGQIDNRVFEAVATVDCYLHGLTFGSLAAGDYIQPIVGFSRNVGTANILVPASATNNQIAIIRVG